MNEYSKKIEERLRCEKVRLSYSAEDIAEMLETRRKRAIENQLYERGKEDAYAEAIALIREELVRSDNQ